MKVSHPLSVVVPPRDVLFAESVHAADFHMAERVDPFHKLIYVLAGRIELREPQRPAAVPRQAGSVLVVPRGVPHAIADVRAATLLLLCVSDEFLQADPEAAELWGQLTKAPDRTLRLSRPSQVRLENMWRRALLEGTYAKVGGAVTARAMATLILVLLARLPARDTGNQAAQRVAAVAREVEETFYDDWNIDRAAARAGLSRRRFSAVFRETMGATFWDFLHRHRLTHAASLLRSGDRSVTGVMFSCGFNDLSHFYRLFRREYGVPPKAWATRKPVAGDKR